MPKPSENQHRQHLALSHLINLKTADPCSMDTLFGMITEAACGGLDVARAGIWLFNEDGTRLDCADLYVQSAGSHDCGQTLTVGEYPDYFDILRTPGTVDAGDVYADPRLHEFGPDQFQASGIGAALDVPVVFSGRVIGALRLEHHGGQRHWEDADRSFALAIADQVAMTMCDCQRNRSQQALREAETRYTFAVEGSADGLWNWSIVSNKIYQSDRLKALWGIDRDAPDLDFDDWKSLLHPDDAEAVLQALYAHLENADIPYDVEYRLRTGTGEYRWFRARGRAERDENGNPYYMAGSITDITETRAAQEDQRLFRAALDEVADDLYMFDPDTLGLIYMNQSAADEIGYSTDELARLTPLDFMPQYDETGFRAMIAPLIDRPGKTLTFDTVHQRKDGSRFPAESRLYYIVPENHSPRFISTIRNITDFNRAESKNRLQRLLLEKIRSVQNSYITGARGDPIFRQLLDGFIEITNSEYGFIGEIVGEDEGGPYLRTRQISKAAWTDEMRGLFEENVEFRRLDTLYGAVITGGEPIISNDPASDPRATGLPAGHAPLHAFVGIPVKRGDAVIGMVGLANRDGGYDESILQTIDPLLPTCASLFEAERTEQRRIYMENALRNSEQRANTVLNTVIDGIITIDEYGIVESYNNAAQGIFGYTADEVIGHNISMLMPEPHKSVHDSYMQRYRETGEAHIIGIGREVEGRRKDATVFPLDLAVNSVNIGGERKFTGVLRDISELKQAEQALIRTRDEAEQANLAKSRFLSSMSHELRTPLNAIMGFSQLIEIDTEASDTNRKHARRIYSAGRHLLELINDVLDLSKIESEHIDLSIENVALPELLAECFRLLESMLKKHRISIGHLCGDDAMINCNNIQVRADATRLKQVLLNLLSNAIKYNSECGSVCVCCPPGPEGFHRICVTDTGPGIDTAKLADLFTPFNRLGAERSGIQGTGIGLVITRRLVELMHGQISIDTKSGKGTTFFVDLPVADDEARHEATTGGESAEPGAILDMPRTKGRVLVAEDNRMNQELIALQLEMLGLDADVADNGEDALKLAVSNRYDLLLTDIHMPDMDGYELTRSLRSSDVAHVRDMIIIAITANASGDEKNRCLTCGMNDYLSKPVEIVRLRQVIRNWLGDGPGLPD